jgi:hypothetical protein
MGRVNDAKSQPDKRSKWAVACRFFRCAGYTLLGCVALILVFVLSIMFQSRIPKYALEAQTKQNSHAIQLALERYAVDHEGLYPQSFAALAPEYMGTPPVNPFPEGDLATWKWWILRSELSQHPVYMRNIPFGDPLFEGNFTYLPWGLFQDGTAAGYYLIAYGSRKSKGQDLDGDGQSDHVIVQLDSPLRFSTTPNIKQQRIPRLDIKELLHPQEVKAGKTGG